MRIVSIGFIKIIKLISIILCMELIVVAVPVVEYDSGIRYEEYIVEHEISSNQAKNAALTIDLQSISSPPGCQVCTKYELKYCSGVDLISDHCCCDKRYHEVLPFIPHTCYQGTQICKPIIGDCAEYTRLRKCCCDKFLLEKWKKKSNGVNVVAFKKVTLILTTFNFIFKYYFIA